MTDERRRILLDLSQNLVGYHPAFVSSLPRQYHSLHVRQSDAAMEKRLLPTLLKSAVSVRRNSDNLRNMATKFPCYLRCA